MCCPGRFESPPYTALIAFVPEGNVAVVKLAEPPLNVPVPNTVVPFMNEMVSPSGARVIIAVKITASP